MSSPYLMYDGAKVSAESHLGKELQKWERKPDWTPEKNPYPKMLYRARHRPDGRRSVHEVNDRMFAERGPNGEVLVVPGSAEQWSRGCQLTVQNEHERSRAFEQGWRDTPQDALELLESRDNAASNATAERHASDVRMSEAAQREAAEADASTLRQVPEVTPEVLKKARAKRRAEAR